MTDVIVPTAPPLARIPRVELIQQGTWNASTGVHTFNADDFYSAVAAMDCPACRRPVLKLGHIDPRFDGEPAVGWIDSLGVTENGLTLVGDFVGMPGWLGDVIASAYPDRSIEGEWGYRCQLGHTHPFVLHAVALLGVQRPGIGTLQSLQDVAALYGVAASVPTTGDPVSVLVRAAAPVHTGAMVALVPSDGDAQRLAVDGGEPSADLHTTLMYLGEAVDWDADARQQVIDAVAQVASGRGPIEVDGFGLSLFNPGGDDPCIVLTLGGDGLEDVHDAVVSSVTDGPVPEQRTPWIPHVTLTYTDDAVLLADLTARTGPVVFDRIRVAFAGDYTDIPLTPTTQAAVSAGERSTMPSPRPTKVAASVSVEDVRREYYDNAPWSHWITEVHLEPLQLLVVDDESGKRYRIPVTVTGEDTFSFGDPVEVLVRYVDKAGDTVAASAPIVYASRAESRPGTKPQASEPSQPVEPAAEMHPEPVPTPAVEDPTIPAEPQVVPNPPAAEPEPNTDPKEEDPVSDLSEFRSRLGLADDADEAAVLAALDARLQPAEPTTDPTPQPVAASSPKLPDGVTVVDKTVLAELRRNAELGAAAHERQRLADRDTAILAARDAGKIPPARVEHWTKAWEADPEGTKATLASLEAGLVVPVQASGYTGAGESDATDPTALTSAEIDDWAAQLGLDPKELTHG